MKNVWFNLNIDKGSKYDDVGVVGNLNELNNWNINNPVSLPYSEKDELFILIKYNYRLIFKQNINMFFLEVMGVFGKIYLII